MIYLFILSLAIVFSSNAAIYISVGDMYITVMDPIDTKNFSSDDVARLTEETRQKMLKVRNEKIE